MADNPYINKIYTDDGTGYDLRDTSSGYTKTEGTVKSVRVQAGTGITSSTSTEQTENLNTTIGLADTYGDTKNPYGSKTANHVLAAPNGSNGQPNFRALTSADIPSIPKSKISDFPTIPQGTVTSARVQATSPVVSSQNTAQSTTLNTTISLADAYGDTKNPYGSKSSHYVLAGPRSGSAAPAFRKLWASETTYVNGAETNGAVSLSPNTETTLYTISAPTDSPFGIVFAQLNFQNFTGAVVVRVVCGNTTTDYYVPDQYYHPVCILGRSYAGDCPVKVTIKSASVSGQIATSETTVIWF